ncbi:unnamed protein product [Rotaria socialis]|uniref:Uncharacterized protein n=1 Tax=Rotaria socialis TaxID=392032 RepID=A0A818CVM4_9BILA|nr:unnamed protein product [Rotaria socialis]CAF4569495.1 unnamed protein product [Rotaria socialis]
MASAKTKETETYLQVEHIGKIQSLLSIALPQDDTKTSGRNPKRYKALLICVICNGDAHGYNFDAISCESCKAFFRRNALQPVEKLKCRGTGSCNVAFNVPKRCKRCRLEKCLTSGMRKAWILSDKEKADKCARIEENRCLKKAHNNIQESLQLEICDSKIDDDLTFDLSSLINGPILNELDWFSIKSIQDCFTGAVRLNRIANISEQPLTQSVDSTVELFRVLLRLSSRRLISYIKQINEFQQLDADDQVYLVKLNLLTICCLHSIFTYDPIVDCYHERDTMDPSFSSTDWDKLLNTQFHMKMKQIRNDLIDIFQSDDILIKLFYLILLFSNQVSLNQSSKCLLTNNNSLSIFKGQNVYTDLVYRYCLHQHGSEQAPILFLRYVNKLMQIQKLVDEIKHSINDSIDITDLSPLMQSLLV